MGDVHHKEACPRCTRKGRDTSKDNLAVYSDGSAFCFACGYTKPSKEWLENNGYSVGEDEYNEEVMSKEKLTKEENEKIKGYTGTKGHGIREITDETYRYYGVRHKYSEETGEPVAQYYPVTEEYEASGYKVRELPKTFSVVGKCGKESDLFGQWRYKNTSGKFVVITAGECFPGYVEVMTENGFIRFDELTRGIKVLQVGSDFKGSFVTPVAYVEKEYNGKLLHLSSAKIQYSATPNHNMVFLDSKGNIEKKPLAEKIKKNRFAKISVEACGAGTGLTEDQIALTLAICADSKIDARKSGRPFVHFGFIKQRKIIRLSGILNRLGINYSSYTTTYADGKTYTTFNFRLPSYISGKVIPQEWVSTATQYEKSFILEELVQWDGNSAKDYFEFSSKHYSECSTVQALCVTSGRYSTIRRRENKYGIWYCVSMHNKELLGGFQQQKRWDEDFVGKVYCVSVPTGMIQIRCRGRVSVVGNCDCLSAHQMFEDERKSKGSDFDPIPVVSATIGETGSAKQISNHYEWLDRFDKVVVCYDMDAAGQEALATLSKVIPKGKMFSMSLPLKDINLMLTEGKSKQFITAFWKAQPYTPDGIIGSGTLSEKMREELATPKIPLPHFMHKLQKMMAGGIPLGRIVNLGSASGTGKSTIIDEMLYFWVFNSPHKIGVVSLESDSGQYGLKILSRHCGKKIELFEAPEDALAFMEEPWVKEKERELLFTEDGNNRWHLVEDRDGGVESMKKQIEKLIIECGCKVIVLDPLQDILDGLPNEDQAIFLKWMKGMIKSHKVTFINVNHVRKSGSGQKAGSIGGEMHEEDFAGSSTIFKSGACNLIFSRNKEAEDPIERNTTYMRATKIRWTGITGVAGEYYYDLQSHTLWDKEEWLHGRCTGF